MRWLLGVLSLWLVAPLGATTWVVAQGSPQAADTNPGSAERPFATISATVSRVRPGDTVRVEPGVYREAIRLRTSGTAGAPIRYLATTPGQVIVSGADLVAGWQLADADVPVYRARWLPQFEINRDRQGRPIEHHPESQPVWGRAELVLCDGRLLVPAGGLDGLRQQWRKRPGWTVKPGRRPVPDFDDEATWPGLFAVDTVKQELYVCLADGSDPNRHQMESASRAAVFGLSPWENQSGLSFVELHGFVFRHAASFPQRAGVWLQGHDNLLSDCTTQQMAGSGIAVGGTVRRCVVEGCGHTGGCAQGHGFINEDSTWRWNSWKPIDRGWDCGGVKICMSDSGCFRRCRFEANGGPGLWLDIHDRQVDITECSFLNNEGSGVFVEISQQVNVVRNLAVGNAVGKVPTVNGPDWASAGIQLGESMNCLVAYNTCVGNKDGIAVREQGPRPLDTPDCGKVDYRDLGDTIVGNVCADNAGYQLGLWYDNPYFGPHPAEQGKYKTAVEWDAHCREIADKVYDPRQAGLVIDRNLYHGAAGRPLLLFGVPWRRKRQEFSELAAWTAATGFDGRGRVGAPGLVAADKGDYRLGREGLAWQMQVGWLFVGGETP